MEQCIENVTCLGETVGGFGGQPLLAADPSFGLCRLPYTRKSCCEGRGVGNLDCRCLLLLGSKEFLRFPIWRTCHPEAGVQIYADWLVGVTVVISFCFHSFSRF